MRLENKMHKWLKFFLKCFPFWFIIFSILNILFNETTTFDISSIITNSFGSSNYFVSAFKQLSNRFGVANDFNGVIVKLISTVFDVTATDTNHTLIFNLLYFVFSSFVWFIFIDIVDLVFSAFRFIINLAHSWLDSFYEKSKRGGK